MSAELLANMRATQDGLATLAVRDLRAALRTLPADAAAATNAAIAAVRSTTAAYGDLAAVAAADFYDDMRASVNAPGRFTAQPAAVAPSAQAEATARWGVEPLWSREPDEQAAIARLSGSVRRLTLQPARLTVLRSSRDEGVRYVRVPRADACDWCLMLGARGAVYHTYETASLRPEDSDEGGYHDSCKCFVTAIHDLAQLPQINRDLAEEWQDVTRGERDQRAAWRRHIAATRGPAQLLAA